MTYEILNAVTTNTLAAFTAEEEARAAFDKLVQADPDHAEELALIAFDERGEAQELLVAPRMREYA